MTFLLNWMMHSRTHETRSIFWSSAPTKINKGGLLSLGTLKQQFAPESQGPGHKKETTVVFQASIFGCKLLVSGRVSICSNFTWGNLFLTTCLPTFMMKSGPWKSRSAAKKNSAFFPKRNLHPQYVWHRHISSTCTHSRWGKRKPGDRRP